MLIKQGKDKGMNLAAAIEAARRFREEHAADAELRLQLGRASSFLPFGRSSEIMSIGAGKTIVVDGDEEISISVCR